MRAAYEIVVVAYRSWSDHRAIRIGAGLSYYWLFAAVPLATLALQLAAAFFSTGDIAQRILEFIREFAQERGNVELLMLIETLIERTSGMTAGFVGALVAAVSTSFAFAATQDAMNMVWDSPRLHGLGVTMRRRLALLLAAVAVAGLLLVALLSIAVAGAVENLLPSKLADEVVTIAAMAAPYVIIFGLITLSFRYMPRPRVPWKPVLIAAVFTLAALVILTVGYTTYLRSTKQSTLAGATGSVLGTLVWFYLLAQAFVAGGVLTRAIHEHRPSSSQDEGEVDEGARAQEEDAEAADDTGEPAAGDQGAER